MRKPLKFAEDQKDLKQLRYSCIIFNPMYLFAYIYIYMCVCVCVCVRVGVCVYIYI